MQVYRVARGDTLWRIAQRFGTTVTALAELNGIADPNRLVVGQALLIPQPASPLEHRVRPGDTLWVLSQLYGVAIQAIAEANRLADPNRIEVGQILVIPGWEAQVYTVQPGDTVWLISRRFGVSQDLIIRANALTPPYIIYVGQRLVIPRRTEERRVRRRTLAYFFPTTVTVARTALDAIAPFATYLALFSANVDAQGAIRPPANAADIAQAAKERGISPQLSLSNINPENPEAFDPDFARNVMATPEAREAYVTQAVDLATRLGFDGINLDFENMYPEDRELYNSLAAVLKDRAAHAGLVLSLAVAPKFSDLPTARWVGTFDYRRLGEIADFIYIMTYEWSWVGGPPGPIAPIQNVRRALEYAVSQIPREKVFQGINLYGYRWELPDTPENLATSVTLEQPIELAWRYGAEIVFDETSKSPTMTYTDELGRTYVIWFEDVESIWEKLKVNIDLNLGGFGYWSFRNIPYGSTAVWNLIGELFVIEKVRPVPES